MPISRGLGSWSLMLGASLELGAWNLELLLHDHAFSIRLAFAPPNPNEFVSTCASFASVGFATTGKAQSGSTVWSVEVGGSHCSRRAMRQTIASTAPAA